MQTAYSMAHVRRELPAVMKRATDSGAVFILKHGRPDCVLMSRDEFGALRGRSAALGRCAVIMAGSGGDASRRRKIAAGARMLIPKMKRAGVGAVVIVTDSAESLDMSAVSGNVTVVPATNRNRGFASSLKRALRFVERDCDSVLIAFASKPGVAASTFKTLFARFEAARHGTLICVPTHSGRRGHPIIISKKLIPEALRMDPRWGLSALIRRHEMRILEAKVNDSSVVTRRNTQK